MFTVIEPNFFLTNNQLSLKERNRTYKEIWKPLKNKLIKEVLKNIVSAIDVQLKPTMTLSQEQCSENFEL